MSELDIKDLRQKLGVTQKELAKMVGVSENTVQNWGYGKKIPSTKHQILCALMEGKTLKTQEYYGGEAVTLPEERNLVPLIPILAQGGSLNDFTTSVMEYDCEKVLSPIKGVNYAMTVSLATISG